MRFGRERRRTLQGEEGEPSVLVLQEGPSPRRRRLLAVLLAGVLLLGLYLGRDVVERWTGVEVPGPESVASLFRSPAPETGAAGGGAADAEAGRASQPGAATPADSGEESGLPERRLDSLEMRLDSLAPALERYRERHGDFVRGRLGCPGLDRGFTQLEERSESAARAFDRAEAGTTTGLPPALLDRYRRLSSTADSLADLFEASGCDEEP